MSGLNAVELQALRAELSSEEAADLDDFLEIADEEAAEEYAGKNSSKMALFGSGSTLRVILGSKTGSGQCNKKGTGAFTGKDMPPGIVGNYSLKVGRITVVLRDQSGKEVWRGKGLQKGLSGTWNIKF